MTFAKILAGFFAVIVVAINYRAQKKKARFVRASGTRSSAPVAPNQTTSRLFSVVSPEDSRAETYPYIQIESDGTARELHQSEREYLETPFEPFDGARPYLKKSYDQKDGWGNLAGFLARSELPPHISIQSAPAENPVKPVSKDHIRQRMGELGFDVSDAANGTIVAKRRKQDHDPQN